MCQHWSETLMSYPRFIEKVGRPEPYMDVVTLGLHSVPMLVNAWVHPTSRSRSGRLGLRLARLA